MRAWLCLVFFACSDGAGQRSPDTTAQDVGGDEAGDAADGQGVDDVANTADGRGDDDVANTADGRGDDDVANTSDGGGDGDAANGADDAGTHGDAADTSTAVCPAPPWGSDVGDTLGDYELFDCDGAPVRLASLCEVEVAYLNTFAGWCPPCRAVAEAAGDDFATWSAWGGSARWLFVITEDADGEVPSLAYCQAIRDDYALPMPTLVDLHGELPAHLGVTSPNSWHVVLSAGMRIEAKLKYGHAAALERAHELLGAP